MTSLLTNTAAQTALQTLTMTNKSLETTQSRISTGFRVATAADNAAYWSIATTMRSDNAALSTVEDALGLGSATVDVAYTAVQQGIDVVSEIKTKLVAAREPGVDRGKIQSEISELQNQLSGIADASVFSGENWLSVDSGAAGYNATKYVVSSFSRTGSTATVGTISIDTSAVKLYDADAAGEGILDGLRDSTTGAIGGDQAYSIANLDISRRRPDDPRRVHSGRRRGHGRDDRRRHQSRLGEVPHRPAEELRFRAQRRHRPRYRSTG
jgi:flagellin